MRKWLFSKSKKEGNKQHLGTKNLGLEVEEQNLSSTPQNQPLKVAGGGWLGGGIWRMGIGTGRERRSFEIQARSGNTTGIMVRKDPVRNTKAELYKSAQGN